MAELRTPQGHALILPEGSVSVGADISNQVPVAAHFGLAPLHFRLQPWEGGHFIEDAGSGLGTLVNGHPVNWKPLVHGDVITAGELEMTYSQEKTPITIQPPAQLAPAAHAPAQARMISLATLPPPVPPAVPSPFPSDRSAPPAPAIIQAPAGPVPLLVPEAAAAPSPPPWLPEDLLPGATPAHHFPPSRTQDQGPGFTPHATPFYPGPRRSKRPALSGTWSGTRLVALAAVLLMLGWIGHAAWQNIHPARAASAPAKAGSGKLPVSRPAPTFAQPETAPSQRLASPVPLKGIPQAPAGKRIAGQGDP